MGDVEGKNGLPSYQVRIAGTEITYRCKEAESLLQGMVRLGIKGIPVGCLNGGCGVCKVNVRAGSIVKRGAMSRAHISEADEMRGTVLACRVSPVEDVDLDVAGKIGKIIAAGVPTLGL